jgi:phospholipase/lecithinase/hemolysin
MRTSLCLGVSLLLCSGLATAGVIDQIVAFGDSLTDNGNALTVYLTDPAAYPAGAPVPKPPNYTLGRFTDGPDTTPASAFPGKVWVEDLASQLGLPNPQPSLLGGTNFAIGSAMTGTTNPQDMGNQVGSFLAGAGGHAAASDLYTFWGGANDLFAGGSGVTAATNITGEVQAIAMDGGKYFLWLNLPPIDGIAAGAVQFDTAMASDLATLRAEFPNDVFISVDVAAFFLGGAGGLNLACTPADLAANPDQCAIWDGVHPTNVAHQEIATLADQALAAAIPEPALWWITGLASVGLIGLRRREAGK